MPIGLDTYMAGNLRAEDVTDLVVNISPAQTPLLSTLGVAGDAKNTLHEYLTDSYAAAAANANAEGTGFSSVNLTAPTRIANKTQIFIKQIQVTGTENAVTNYAGNPFEYQIEKSMKECAKDIELALMAGSTASGSSGVARQLTGVINGIVTNATARASGSSLGEVTFNDIQALIYASTNEFADKIFVGSTLKRDISGFSATNTKEIAAGDKRLVASIAVYESDFGIHEIKLHRDVPTGANDKSLVALCSDKWKVSYLTGRRPAIKRLPNDGDRERAMIIGELTLENRAEKANAYVSGFTA